MTYKNLLDEYPDLIEKCREWDCSYQEAISRIESDKKKSSLMRYMNDVQI